MNEVDNQNGQLLRFHAVPEPSISLQSVIPAPGFSCFPVNPSFLMSVWMSLTHVFFRLPLFLLPFGVGHVVVFGPGFWSV